MRAILGRPALVLLPVLSLFWASMLIATPYLVSHLQRDPQVIRTASVVYVLGAFVCHQRPERSFHPWGTQSPVCARCEGIYLAAPFAFVLGASRRRARPLRSRRMWQRIVLLACLPTLLTLVWEWTTGDITPGVVRAMAGGMLGAAIAATVAAVTTGDLR
jgi:hypothetical protein